jgi:hypothetical protein
MIFDISKSYNLHNINKLYYARFLPRLDIFLINNRFVIIDDKICRKNVEFELF